MTKLRTVVCAFALAIAGFLSVHAQVTKITNPSAFDQNSVTLDFQEYQADILACDIFGKWGLSFQNNGDAPRIAMVIPPIGGAEADRVLLNQSSPDLPLVINFKFPVSRVGFYASNGSSSTAVVLTAFDPLGTKLGTVTENGLAEEKFIGISTTSNRGIAKLLVDYGGAAEQIDNIVFTYVDRPQFKTYLAQVGDAKDMLETILVISNLTNSTATGELRLFSSNGTTMTVKLGGQSGTVFPFSLPPFSSKTLPTGATSNPLVVGYAEIESNVPVEGTAIFRLLSGQNVLAEAGVGAAVPRHLVVGAVQKIAALGFDTGVAVVNASDQPVDARVLLYNESGMLVAVNEKDLDLGPHGQMPKYVSELFPQIKDSDFTGTLVVTSDKPIALVVIRTQGALVHSTLPVGSTQQ